MKDRNALRLWLLALLAGLRAFPARLSALIRRLLGPLSHGRSPSAIGGWRRRPPARAALPFPSPAAHGRDWRSAGLVIPTALMAALLIIGTVALLTARSLGSWVRGVNNADLRAAREAAEYGFNEIVGQLNTDANAYLWVTKSANWQTLTASDLAACGVIAPTPPAANRIAGVDSNSSNKSKALPNNSALSYSLTDFTEPQFPPGQSNFVSGSLTNACTDATTGAKFGNLKGGSATLEVKGMVTRAGSELASYTLRRAVHVKWPNDSLANPMLFLGLGSELKLLDGNMCTTTNTSVTSCTGLPPTIVGCISLEDCLVWNVDIPNKTRDQYCAVKGTKFKKGVLCNSFQQASDTLPVPPVPADFGDSRTTTSNGWLYPPNITCKQTSANKYFSENKKYNSRCDVTTYTVAASGAVSSSTTKDVDFRFAPYTGAAPSGSASLSTTLVPGCQYNSKDGKPSGATGISCVYGNVTTTSDEMYWITAYAVVQKKSNTITTPALPLNLFIRGALNLADAGINNNSVSNWANLRLFGRNSGATMADGSPNCTSQSVTASTKSGIGVDGAFLWFPNATIAYQSAAGVSAAYTVMWVCKFTGPTKGNPGDYWIVNPLSRRGVNAGLKAALAGYGGNVNATTYRAYGVSAEL